MILGQPQAQLPQPFRGRSADTGLHTKEEKRFKDHVTTPQYLRGQSMASLLIERYPPLKALSSSLWTPSVCLFAKGHIQTHQTQVQSFLCPSCYMLQARPLALFRIQFLINQMLWVFSSLKGNKMPPLKGSRTEWQHQQSHSFSMSFVECEFQLAKCFDGMLNCCCFLRFGTEITVFIINNLTVKGDIKN